ncbi:MAG: HEPN domain-containing protein [Candidatus Altiarchaeota archaeon]
MSHAENKVDWCLRKAEKELKGSGSHRGLVKTRPDLATARRHIRKAEHNLKAMSDFKGMGYSDWSASAAFYSIYHCLLAITAKFGYESRNQDCTFALIYKLIEDGMIDLDAELIRSVHEMNAEEKQESSTIISVRESQQYGVTLSLEDDTFNKMLRTVMVILDRAKEVLEG